MPLNQCFFCILSAQSGKNTAALAEPIGDSVFDTCVPCMIEGINRDFAVAIIVNFLKEELPQKFFPILPHKASRPVFHAGRDG